MSAHLSPLDASFLELEEADDSAHMHIGWAMAFDPLPSGEAPSLRMLREQTVERLDLVPRFRRRLSSPRVGSLSLPTWEPDPDFDIANHMRVARLPAPGGEEELLEWLGDFYSHRLDRARPLWETTLLEGLADGRWALVTKTHHCLVDGVGGSSVAATFLDTEPEPADSSPSLAEVLAATEREQGDEPGRVSRLRGALGSGVDTLIHPSKLGAALSHSRALAEMLVRDELISAPHTSLNEKIGATRQLAAIDVPLEQLKRIKNELGGTVNDIVLTATASGLRRLFELRGELPEVDKVRAMVPVNLRQAGDAMALGNRVSSLFVELPLDDPDLLIRYRKTAAAAQALKRADQASGTEALIELAGAAPPVIHSAIARLAFTPRLFNLTITNVPGPPMPLYALGAPMRRVIPLVPIFSGHAVGVAVVSYDGNVTFGINADRATVRDLGAMREGIEESLAELSAAGRAKVA